MGCLDRIAQSKLQIPATSPQFIHRSRLLRQLEQATERLILISASVGWGKTVLLTHYAHCPRVCCAWYHLSESDNDSAAFMRYLELAVKKAVPEFEFDMERHAAFVQDDEWIDAMARDFCAALPAMEDGELGIVLDDFQAIHNSTIFRVLRTVVECLPPHVKLIIATKSAVPNFCVRYIVGGEALVLGRDDLSFCLPEVREAIAPVCERDHLERIAASVMESSEGWPAGIRFCILYLKQQRRGSWEEGLDTIYNRKLVHDYIMHEVYRKLPFDIQMFLTKTSVLDVLGDDICNAVTKRGDSKSILHYLEQENMFVSHVGKPLQQYRYHGIFREFLEQQLKPEMRRESLDLAARFYLRTENKEQAVEYAIANDNTDFAQSAIESAGMYMLEQGKLETLGRWIGYLERRAVRFTARNHLIFGMYHYRSGDTARAIEMVERAQEMFLTSMNEVGYLNAMLYKARILRDQESLESSCMALEFILKRPGLRNSWIRYAAVMEKLYNLLHMARYGEALAICSEMILHARNTANRKAEAGFIRFSSSVLFFMGQYDRAVRVYEEACRLHPLVDAADYAGEFSTGGYIALIYVLRGEGARGKALVDEEVRMRQACAQQEDLWVLQLLKSSVYLLQYKLEGGDYSLYNEAMAAYYLAEQLAAYNKENRLFLHLVEMTGRVLRLCFDGDWDAEAAEELLMMGRAEENTFLREMLLGCLAGACYCRGSLRNARRAGELCLKAAGKTSLFAVCAHVILSRVLATESEASARQHREQANLCAEKNGVPIPEGFFHRNIEIEAAGAQIAVECFGEFAIAIPGRDAPFKWRTRKAQELFAYLFHFQGKTVGRDTLLNTLWPEVSGKNAVSLLHTTLYSIRRSMNKYGMADLIEYREKKYRLNMSRVDSSLPGVLAVFQAMEQGRYALVRRSGQMLLDLKGRYMEDIDGAWAVEMREYVENMSLKCYRYIATTLMESGLYEDAVAYLKACIAIDPYAEYIYEMLLRCFGMLEDVKNVKLYYQRLSAVLMEELGVQPDKRTRQTYYQCLCRLKQPSAHSG